MSLPSLCFYISMLYVQPKNVSFYDLNLLTGTGAVSRRIAEQIQCGDEGGDTVVGDIQQWGSTKYNKPFTPQDNRRVATISLHFTIRTDIRMRRMRATHALERIFYRFPHSQKSISKANHWTRIILRFQFPRHKGIPTGCQHVTTFDSLRHIDALRKSTCSNGSLVNPLRKEDLCLQSAWETMQRRQHQTSRCDMSGYRRQAISHFVIGVSDVIYVWAQVKK